jgi:copper chaperone
MSVFRVPDIHCDACIRSMTSAVQRLDPTATLQADLGSRQVRVESTASGATVADALRDAGFTVEPA